MSIPHHYALELHWTPDVSLRVGDVRGSGRVRGFSRAHEVSAPGVPTLLGSADPTFHGDPSRWNPEQLLVASLAQCHMLTYLWLAAGAGVTVTAYADTPVGTMVAEPDGSGRFAEVTLRPVVTVAADSDHEVAASLHARVGEFCFIARSVNFPVRHDASLRTADDGPTGG